jgi:hypothetical protein
MSALLGRYGAWLSAIFLMLGMASLTHAFGRWQLAVRVEGQVIAVKAACNMEATISKSGRTRTVRTGTVPCNEVELQKAFYPDEQFTVTRIAKVRVAYFTPEGMRYEATLDQTALNLDVRIESKPGDRVQLEYDPADPEAIRGAGSMVVFIKPFLLFALAAFLALKAWVQRQRDARAGESPFGTPAWADKIDVERAASAQGPIGGVRASGLRPPARAAEESLRQPEARGLAASNPIIRGASGFGRRRTDRR